MCTSPYFTKQAYRSVGKQLHNLVKIFIRDDPNKMRRDGLEFVVRFIVVIIAQMYGHSDCLLPCVCTRQVLQGPSKHGGNGLLGPGGVEPEVCSIPKKFVPVFRVLERNFEGRMLVQAVETSVQKLSQLRCNSGAGSRGSLDLSLFQSAGDYAFACMRAPRLQIRVHS